MYLDDGKCAQCGKKLEASTSYSPHNVQLQKTAFAHPRRPVFCSPRCLDAAIQLYFVDDKTSESAFDRRELEIEAKYDPEYLQKQYEEAHRAQHEKMLSDPSRPNVVEHLKMLDHHIDRKQQIYEDFCRKLTNAPADLDRELQELATQRKQYHDQQIQTALHQFLV